MLLKTAPSFLLKLFCIGFSSIAFSQNLVKVIPVPVPVQNNWNDFHTQFISDYDVPTSYDSVLGMQAPNKQLIWHTPFRNIFRTQGGDDAVGHASERNNMFHRGITAFNSHTTEVCTEQEADTRWNPSCMGPNPVFETQTQIVTGGGIGGDDIDIRGNWNDWLNWWRSQPEMAYASRASQTNGKANVFLTYPDYESTYTHGSDQLATNYLVTGMYAMLEKSNGYVGQMYLGPINSGGYINEACYDPNNVTPAWAWATDGSVPSAYQNKTNKGNRKIMGSIEVAHYYETLLPQGLQVKDQNNTNWFITNHFGANANVEHWAARVGGLTECSFKHTNAYKQKLVVQLKANCDRSDCYQYSPEAVWNGGRYIKEYGRYATQQPGFTSNTGAEFITPFIQEGQYSLAYFSGAHSINLWNSAFTPDAIPKTKVGNNQRGTKFDDPTYGNVDLEGYSYVLKAMKSMNTSQNGLPSFMQLCDGKEIYYNENTEVSIDGGLTYHTYRALDWQLLQVPPVRVVYNPVSGKGACLSFLAYEGSTEARSFKFRVTYNNQIVFVSDAITLNNNEVNIHLFSSSNTCSATSTNVTTTTCSNEPYTFGNQSLSASGKYTRVIVTSGGCDSTVHVNLTVIPTRSSTKIRSICTGATYNFLGDILNTEGTYVKTITGVNGCDSAVTLHLYVVNLAATLATHSDSLFANAVPNATYKWIDCADNSVIAQTNTPYFVPATNGRYSVVVAPNGACSDTSDCISFTRGSTGITTTNNFFTMYPNPANEYIEISNNAIAEEIKEVTFYDLTGKQLTTKQSSLLKWNTHDWSNGIYIVKITTTNKTYNQKISIQH